MYAGMHFLKHYPHCDICNLQSGQCVVSCGGPVGRERKLAEEVGCEPGFQECWALLAVGRGRVGAAVQAGRIKQKAQGMEEQQVIR